MLGFEVALPSLLIFPLAKFILLYLVIPIFAGWINIYFVYPGGDIMKTRKLELGKRNMVGARVTEARLAKGMKQKELLAKLQTMGIEISTPALSLLEGQKRPVTDYELNALADILGVSVDWLLGREEK